MSAKQEKNGSWTAQFRYTDIYGKSRHKCKRGFASEEAAEEFEVSFKKALAGDVSMRFCDFVELYAADIRPTIREHTWEVKEYMINAWLIPFFGMRPMNSICSKDIMQWQNKLLSAKGRSGQPYAPTYVRTINNQLIAIFNHAERFYNLSPNPTKNAKRIGDKNAGEMQVWTKDEYLRFSKALKGDDLMYLSFELLYWTGIRLCELQALYPGDFNFTESTLSITKSYHRIRKRDLITPPKSEKSVRTIVMPEFLRDEVREYFEVNSIVAPKERIFTGVTGESLRKAMNAACEAASVKKIRVHDLRHSHVSLLIDMGYSAVGIAERLGHESTDITFRYAHMFPTAQSDMADSIQKLRGDGDAR